MLHLTKGTILMSVVCITALTAGCATIDSAVNEQAKPAPHTLQASQQATYNGPRARLAVLRFTDSTDADWGYSPKIGQGMARKLQDALINSKRFQVVTRDLADLEHELAFQHHTGMVSPSTAAQFGRKLGTRLVLTATVTDFEDTTPANQNHASRSRPSSGNSSLKNIAAGVVEKWASAGKTYIAMNVQVVDVQSGEIVASKQVSAAHKDTSMTAAVTGEVLGADIRSWDTLPRGKALRDVIDQTVAFLAEPGGLPNAYFTAPAFNVAAARQKIEPDQLSLKMQRALQGLGYYHGAIDGMIGPQTSAAIEQFQKDYNLTVTGFFDPPTTKKLLELASAN